MKKRRGHSDDWIEEGKEAGEKVGLRQNEKSCLWLKAFVYVVMTKE